jgi:energy-coupling factor transporter ATP-binding protein EcfA2
MGVLFQSGALFTDLDVFENVAFPLRVHTKLPEDMIRDIVLLKLQAVGLRGAVELMPDELSGGMKRRVALARAIALDPQILMYDEPFVGQDPIAMGVLVRLIRLLNDALGITSVVVSHDLAETASIADYLYVVGDGQVLGQGTPQELMQSDNPRIRQFMTGIQTAPCLSTIRHRIIAKIFWGSADAQKVIDGSRSPDGALRDRYCCSVGAFGDFSGSCLAGARRNRWCFSTADSSAVFGRCDVAGDHRRVRHFHRHGAGVAGLQHSLQVRFRAGRGADGCPDAAA